MLHHLRRPPPASCGVEIDRVESYLGIIYHSEQKVGAESDDQEAYRNVSK